MYFVSTFKVDNLNEEYGTSGLLQTKHGSLQIFDELQCWQKESLQVLFYGAKVPTLDGYSV